MRQQEKVCGKLEGMEWKNEIIGREKEGRGKEVMLSGDGEGEP